MGHGKKRHRHESYGVIEIVRMSANPGINLFGSDIKASQLICLKIKKAEMDRDLGSDFVYAGESYVEVMMSELQFAHAITSLNHGTGTPVTVTRVDGELVEECPQRSKMQEITNEFEDHMKTIMAKAEILEKDIDEKLNSKGSLKVGDKKILEHQMRMLLQDIRANLPFMGKQFVNTMDKVKTETFSEIEAYNSNMLTQVGREALASGVGEESQKLLMNPVLVKSAKDREPLITKEEAAVYGGKPEKAVANYCQRTGLSLQTGKEVVEEYRAKLVDGEEQ